jgi:hypothetical protein
MGNHLKTLVENLGVVEVIAAPVFSFLKRIVNIKENWLCLKKSRMPYRSLKLAS